MVEPVRGARRAEQGGQDGSRQPGEDPQRDSRAARIRAGSPPVRGKRGWPPGAAREALYHENLHVAGRLLKTIELPTGIVCDSRRAQARGSMRCVGHPTMALDRLFKFFARTVRKSGPQGAAFFVKLPATHEIL